MAKNMELLTELLKINVFKLGEFTLKSGVPSPIYIDLRAIITFPDIVKKIVEDIRVKQNESNIQMDVICGVPYTALPIASVFSVLYSTSMIMKRKEAKNYGTKKMVEGIFTKGMKCLIIEDIVSSGSSIVETVEVLRKEGLIVTDCIAILNRMQGGKENLANNGITLHSLYNINDLFKRYCEINEVDKTLVKNVTNYLKSNSYIPMKVIPSDITKPFQERASLCKQPVLKRLFNIIKEKESNLCVSVDVVHSKHLLEITEKVGPHICMLKTHIDVLNDFTPDVANSLESLSRKFNFLIMEDRKFADIGNTVMHQYSDGLYNISQWADIVTVHGIPGSGIIEALKLSSKGQERACILIAEMSSKGALTDESYRNKVIEMAKEHLDFVIGFVCQQKLLGDDNIIHMTPGVNISAEGDTLGQQYKSPESVISNGTDVIIVGRGICNAEDIVYEAVQYKTRGYSAYLKKCQV
ncbi:uncharacterized protein [Parasteatoda tepidariorum]|uniref:Uridine 5'-monophosphate synthase n=1 Tax=Parasteatoda tepidariorum TaxID=114398 RepID=A0A2L2Y8S9_PARTP|nr:uridine 5'-monophosphate synthase [Parasteatoda tepidariorum]